MFRYFSIVFKCMLLLAFFNIGQIQAQTGILKKTEAYFKTLTKLKQEIKINPDNLKAHKEFIDSIRNNQSDLNKQYKEWIGQFPTSAIVPYAIDKYYESLESPKAESYLLKAVANNLKFSEAWHSLSNDASRWGRFTEAQEYLKKAVEADPENVNYQMEYASSFNDNDHSKFIELGLKLVESDLSGIECFSKSKCIYSVFFK